VGFGKIAPTFRDDPAIRIGREAALSDREGVRRMLAQHAACRDED
jgi:hypothetical protein